MLYMVGDPWLLSVLSLDSLDGTLFIHSEHTSLNSFHRISMFVDIARYRVCCMVANAPHKYFREKLHRAETANV